MSLAQLVVAAVRIEGRTKAEVSRDYGVSARWIYELCRRFDAEGEAGLEPRSRRPHRSPRRTSDVIEDEIVELRKELSDLGVDAGAWTIEIHLRRRHPGERLPSTATIWRILSRRGFVTPQPQKRPRSSWIRFSAEMPNERWQADITHWRLAGGTEVEILNVLDDHSRLLVGSDARMVFKAADVVASFHAGAAAHGLPASLLTDNGAVFTAGPRGGRCLLELECDRLAIRHVNSRPYHPQTCGKVERFRDYYNTVRPHRAIGRRTPAEAFGARPKATPRGMRREVAPHVRVRRDKVDIVGRITLRHDSKLHHIGLGRRYTGMRVIALVDGLRVRIITEDGELIRELTLDPSRDYQPHGRS